MSHQVGVGGGEAERERPLWWAQLLVTFADCRFPAGEVLSFLSQPSRE